ncbi:hypothetical protein Tco_1317488 [Tanacetum coccineum]
MEQRNLTWISLKLRIINHHTQLGDEVIEQEVYGIDPYTHNLLLDSIPEESDWHLLDKHGTDNTPMKYPLKPVVEDILKKAKVDHDTRTLELCQHMLKSMSSRPDGNYVANRKAISNKPIGILRAPEIPTHVEEDSQCPGAYQWNFWVPEEERDTVLSMRTGFVEEAKDIFAEHLHQ